MNLAWSESTTIQTYLFLICGESHLWYSNPYGVFVWSLLVSGPQKPEKLQFDATEKAT